MPACYIRPERCIMCGFCQVICPEKAIEAGPGGPRHILPHRCTGCGLCINHCLGLAIAPANTTSKGDNNEDI